MYTSCSSSSQVNSLRVLVPCPWTLKGIISPYSCFYYIFILFCFHQAYNILLSYLPQRKQNGKKISFVCSNTYLHHGHASFKHQNPHLPSGQKANSFTIMQSNSSGSDFLVWIPYILNLLPFSAAKISYQLCYWLDWHTFAHTHFLPYTSVPLPSWLTIPTPLQGILWALAKIHL